MADAAEFRGARRNPQVETMAYAGETPWHPLGVDLGDEAQTSEVMLKAAGIDWEVALGNLYGPNRRSIPTHKAVYRISDGAVFGISRGQYQIVQNREAFAFCDSLIQDGIARYETAGSLMGGRKTWVLMQMPEGSTVVGEAYKRFVLFSNSFDLSSAITVKYVKERVVCRNTHMIALAEDGLEYRMRHFGDMEKKLDTARSLFRVVTEKDTRLNQLLEMAATIKVGEGDRATFETALFGGSLDEVEAPQRKHAIETFLGIYRQEQDRNGETAYSLWNATTGYADHAAQFRGKVGSPERAENRFRSIAGIEGGNALKFKAKAMDVLGVIYPELKPLVVV